MLVSPGLSDAQELTPGLVPAIPNREHIGIGVVQGGELAFAEGYGHADIVLGKPYTPESRQRIGSITKTIVSLCLMALVDEAAVR